MSGAMEVVSTGGAGPSATNVEESNDLRNQDIVQKYRAASEIANGSHFSFLPLSFFVPC